MRRLIARLCRTTPATTATSRLPPSKFPILRTETLLSKSFSFFLMVTSFLSYQSFQFSNKEEGNRHADKRTQTFHGLDPSRGTGVGEALPALA